MQCSGGNSLAIFHSGQGMSECFRQYWHPFWKRALPDQKATSGRCPGYSRLLGRYQEMVGVKQRSSMWKRDFGGVLCTTFKHLKGFKSILLSLRGRPDRDGRWGWCGDHGNLMWGRKSYLLQHVMIFPLSSPCLRHLQANCFRDLPAGRSASPLLPHQSVQSSHLFLKSKSGCAFPAYTRSRVLLV